jgi:alpha-D-xyloside xylohydrolase
MKRARLGLLLAALAPQQGCYQEAVEPAPRVLTLGDGTYALSVDVVSLSLELRRGDELLTTLDGASFALGVVDEVRDETSYDPYPLLAEMPGYLPPAGVAFHEAARVVSASTSGERIVLTLEHTGGARSTLTLELEREGTFRLMLVPEDPTRVAWLRVGATAAEGEAFYGLGEHFDDVDNRGKLRAMQIEVADLESGYNEAHAPVPFVIGTRGWGLFVESSYPGAFDVGAADAARVAATFGLGSAAHEGLVAHLYAAEHPLDVTARYYRSTGAPRLPAPWALGPLVWRDENDDQAQVESDLAIMRELDLPASGIWIDRPYASAVNTFDFEDARFPDESAMIARAHDLGFRVGLWHVPYLDEMSPFTAPLVAQAEDAGYYPLETGLRFNGWGRPIDFTSAGAVAWWQDKLSSYVSLGVEGFKLDYAEDVVPGAFGARNVYRFRDGSDERTMHRGYTLAYHQTYAQLLPEDGGLLLCRAARWGDQVHGPIVWPGDLDARMWRHGQQVTEGGRTFKAVGGLEASMIAGLTLGPSGLPFYGADTGGYRHAPPDLETFIRWFQQTALSSVMQIGTGSSDVAWELGDAALVDLYRRYTRLHLRLFPYTWTLAQQIASTGRPIQRPFGLQEPSYGEHPSDQYFYGDALLVAPVVEPGLSERSVMFPDGAWIDFFEGTTIEGGQRLTVAAPLDKLPLYLRQGAIVPMLRPTIDTLSPTAWPAEVDSFANDPGDLFVIIAPGASSELSLYDGARVETIVDEATVAVVASPGEIFRRGVELELIALGAAAPLRVAVDELTLEPASSREELTGLAQGFYWDAGDRAGTLIVKVALEGGRRVVIER